ncbi:3-deoxy-7-phosphoheptulonate synthase, partial [Halanaerobium salsuginis]
MIAVLKQGANKSEQQQVVELIEQEGFVAHPDTGAETTIVGVVGAAPDKKINLKEKLQVMSCVEKVVVISDPYKLTSWNFKQEKTVIELGDGVEVGGEELTIMAGP